MIWYSSCLFALWHDLSFNMNRITGCNITALVEKSLANLTGHPAVNSQLTIRGILQCYSPESHHQILSWSPCCWGYALSLIAWHIEDIRVCRALQYLMPVYFIWSCPHVCLFMLLSETYCYPGYHTCVWHFGTDYF